MAHVTLENNFPGIAGLMRQFPETAVHLRGLAHALLRGPSPLTTGERELIAAYVSAENNCKFCMLSHAAAAKSLLGAEWEPLLDTIRNPEVSADLDDRMKALLMIAGKVRESGLHVSDGDIARARAAGADDKAIHDTVLIAAAFSMYNRYVDGLGTFAPPEPTDYDEMGEALAEHGYAMRPSPS